MIQEQHGNLLEARADALVNTVNTVGVMGKGIALQFKRAFPANYKAYKRACDRGEVELGRMFVWDAGALASDGPRYVINFPTKKHWRSKSRLADIEAGLKDLRRVVEELGIQSVALPPLGCGHGGLRWSDVKPAITAALDGLDAEVQLFPPEGTPPAAEQPIRTERPRMTPGRAALIGIMRRYIPYAVEITNVDIQKLMYFMQEAGEPLRLNYGKGPYGPYADNLRHVLSSMEGHFVSGIGDLTSRPLDALPFALLPGAVEEASHILAGQPETLGRFERVAALIEGYESTYGLELLATVHWAATRSDGVVDSATDSSDELVLRTVQSWNDRKGRLFTDRHVHAALDRLRTQGWLAEEPQPATLF